MSEESITLKEQASIDATYQRIRAILGKARSNAYHAVNFAMFQAYWEVGRIIVEDEQKGAERAEYGKGLMKELSIRLTKDYGRGFDESNLRKMRLFYSENTFAQRKGVYRLAFSGFAFRINRSILREHINVRIATQIKHFTISGFALGI